MKFGLLWLGLLLGGLSGDASARDEHELTPELDAATIMERVRSRQQQYPYVYEEQTLVLVDRQGRRNSRRLRRYSRLESDGRLRFLVVFDAPAEIAGVAFLSDYRPDHGLQQQFHLPALGARPVSTRDPSADGLVLGTDFSIDSLMGRSGDAERYQRCEDLERDADVAPLLCVAAYASEEDVAAERPQARHYVHVRRAMILRTDFLNDRGVVERRQTLHDLVPVGGGAWRPNLVRMHNLRLRHQSLLRVERRVFSEDRVPEALFSLHWLHVEDGLREWQP